MPGFDGTGPSGMGPMTGGGFGRCAVTADGAVNYGRGGGRGMGRGRGFRRRVLWNAGPNSAAPLVEVQDNSEVEALKNRIKVLEDTIYRLDKNNAPNE